MPKQDGFRWLRQHADALLFFGAPGEATAISAKLMDYLGLDLPIVGVCEGNEAAEILRRTRAGVVCDFNVSAIANAVRQVVSGKWSYEPDRGAVQFFSVGQQMEVLARLIGDTIEKSDPGRRATKR